MAIDPNHRGCIVAGDGWALDFDDNGPVDPGLSQLAWDATALQVDVEQPGTSAQWSARTMPIQPVKAVAPLPARR